LCCTTSFFPDKEPWLARIAAVEKEGTAPLAAAIVERWYTPEFAAANPDVIAESVAELGAASDVGYRGCCTAIVDWDHRDRLGAVTAPTLVIGGDADLATPIEPHLMTVAAGIPGARLEVLAGAHLATVERAEAATRLILDHVHP
jgi:pimeloyl-ACP methyl ester carboxylesterase